MFFIKGLDDILFNKKNNIECNESNEDVKKSNTVISDNNEQHNSMNNFNIYNNKLYDDELICIKQQGNEIRKNTPTLNRESIKKIRSDCQQRIIWINRIKSNFTECDEEYDDIEDIVDCLNEIIDLCKENKTKEILESGTARNIATTYSERCEEFDELITEKGWSE